MANLVKSASGLIFHDDFSKRTLLWSLFPQEEFQRLHFTNDGLVVDYGSKYLSYMIVEPEYPEYCTILKMTHGLTDYKDIAGMIIMQSNKQYAECQSYLADEPSELNNVYYAVELRKLIELMKDEASVVFVSPTSEELPKEVYYDNYKAQYDDIPGFADEPYPWIKMHKVNNTYTFYASKDGYRWIEVGGVKYEACGEIGLFQHGTEDEFGRIDQDLMENGNCVFNYFSIYNSKYIIIEGLDVNTYDIEIQDNSGHTIFQSDDPVYEYLMEWEDKQCIINTVTFPMPVDNMNVRIYKKGEYNKEYRTYEVGKTYGGDKFQFEHDIRIFINNVEVKPDEIFDLGKFYSGNYYIPMEIRNYDEDIAYNKHIKVTRYSEYYNGDEEILMAVADDTGLGKLPEPDSLHYAKEVVLDSIKPTQGRTVYLKLNDRPIQDFFMTADDFRFRITID